MFYLPAGKTASVSRKRTLRFTLGGQPVGIQAVTGFVSRWSSPTAKCGCPSRADLDRFSLAKVLPASAEEQRLDDIYVKRGLDALERELGKY